MSVLSGCRVVVTRPAAQAGELSTPLREAGAEVIEIPMIAIADPPDGGAALRGLVESLGEFAWLIVTSANGAHRFFSAVDELDGAAIIPAGLRVAAVGPATARELARFGVTADLVPERYMAESLVEAFPGHEVGEPDRVALVRAVVGRDVVPRGLEELGWRVDVVEAYTTVRLDMDSEQLASVDGADVVTFTSPSAVDGFMAALGARCVPRVVACIGPVSAAAARRHGLGVDVEAPEHTVPGLVDALIAHMASRLS